jgi:ABC-type Fe3+-citrate transport system substrate-binding protein
MKKFFRLVCFLMVISIGVSGCDQPQNNAKAPAKTSPTHAHEHKHAETLAEGIKQVSEAYAAIKAAFENGSPDDAHDAMHDVGHLLLDDMPELLSKSSLDEDTKTKITAARKTVAEALGKLDEGYFHGGGEKVDFAEMDKVIAPAMEELKGLVK